ncbi:hypothetical protein [Calycomorphotria hydatis]|uniref:Uncharacterized protein n=1 Tax=Calycomorphotria hydatis TaxID=2528027 RepID=A0A517T7U3_9PLAN|nr:hypothetical protein [Calycomorphotria hydatis]QDT64453.1 hypothetical protein V22_16870 [Calycomorphotria hydatis]
MQTLNSVESATENHSPSEIEVSGGVQLEQAPTNDYSSEKWDIRCARRVVAAYLTSCGMQDPDIISTVSKGVVSRTIEAAGNSTDLGGFELVKLSVERAVDELAALNRRFYRRREPNNNFESMMPEVVPTDVATSLRQIFDEYPNAWVGCPQETEAAGRVLNSVSREIVPTSVPTKMYAQPLENPPTLLRQAFWQRVWGLFPPRVRGFVQPSE